MKLIVINILYLKKYNIARHYAEFRCYARRKIFKKEYRFIDHEEIKLGEDFNLLAKEFSEGARANQGESYPWLQLKDIDKSLHQYLNSTLKKRGLVQLSKLKINY